MLLEFAEAKTPLRNLTILNPQGSTYQEKVRNLLKKVATRFPHLAASIGAEFATFEGSHKLLANSKFPDPEDYGKTILLKNCSDPVPVVVQMPPAIAGDPWFLLNADIWLGIPLDQKNRAGAAVHESVYRIGIRNGAEHSVGVRALVAFMFSREFDSISDAKWISAMQQARMTEYEMEGARIPLFSGRFQACEPLPGEAECEKIAETLRPGIFSFEGGGRLTQVDYEEARTIQVDGPNGDSVELTTNHLNFERDSHGNVILKGRGTLTFVSAGVAGHGNNEKTFEFDGVVIPKTGRVEGLVESMDSDAGTDSDSDSTTPIYGSFSQAKMTLR
jgi:hypothetical protein